MRRILLPSLGVLLSLAGLSFGVTAATGALAPHAVIVTVSIDKGGYAPNFVSIHTDEYVRFVNKDTVAHEIAFSSTFGVSCTPKVVELQPSGVGLCSFSHVGTFAFHDGHLGGLTYRGTIVVTRPDVPATITSAPEASFVDGTASSVMIHAVGRPTPRLSMSGTLPAGLTFSSTGPGLATISGTTLVLPGAYPVTVFAANGAGAIAHQELTIDVTQPPAPGYALATASGETLVYGQSHPAGQIAVNTQVRPVVAILRSPGDFGFYLVTARGGVYNRGGAPYFGSAAALRLGAPITAAAATPDGHGYWLVAADGVVYGFGDASRYSSLDIHTGSRRVVAIVPTPDGKGYWLTTNAGNIYNFGDAGFYGSPASRHDARRIVAMEATPDGKGYWLTTGAGNVYNFGDADFLGSTASDRLSHPVVAMMPTLDGKGYYLATGTGNLYPFGDARFYGSPVHARLRSPVVGVAIPD